MEKNWLDGELTFEQLDVPDGFEYENMTDDLGDDPADDEWIKAVAVGEYKHALPVVKSEKTESAIDRPNFVPDSKALEQARLFGFAKLMGWDDADEAEYLKAIVENKPGRAVVIKDLIEIKNTDNENV